MTTSSKTESDTRRRTGRPTREETKRLDEHLLDVAENHFLAHGFEGASMDQIALEARASKRTIYHRYAGKQTLFEAVIERALVRLVDQAVGAVGGADIETRLARVALDLVERILRPEILALMRVVIAEAHRFQDLAQALEHRGWKRLSRVIAVALDLEVAAGALRLTQPTALAAEQFLALTITPLALRALMGGNLDAAKTEAEEAVRQAVPLFLHGCAYEPNPAEAGDPEASVDAGPPSGRGRRPRPPKAS